MIKIELDKMYAKILLEAIDYLINALFNEMEKTPIRDKDFDRLKFYNLVLNICAQSIENAINKE